MRYHKNIFKLNVSMNHMLIFKISKDIKHFDSESSYGFFRKSVFSIKSTQKVFSSNIFHNQIKIIWRFVYVKQFHNPGMV
ncbi:unnamed protein product [Blepharisma stoltei]|uniref:Uncharacterized protein n=1 Tax=Blepharisma stoltei TaxID=1481888 RepID=A0AAU9IWG3_9CILI|nr:unnamed protein product [Blepharisma stoltei]